MYHERSKITLLTIIFIFLAAIHTMGNLIPRHESVALLWVYFASFFMLIGLARYFSSNENLLLGSGLLARLLLFFSMPSLSDDIYRFIWDGYLGLSGYDVFALLPTQALELNIPGNDQVLFDLLNSKNYYTVYPPILQYIFRFAVLIGDWINPNSWLIAANFLRLLFVLADLLSYGLLKKLIPENRKVAFWYFLNPLVIMEFTGNLHAEGLIIPLLLLSIYLIKSNKRLIAAISMALAIGLKLLPLIYLPSVLLKSEFKKALLFAFVSGTMILFFLLPMLLPIQMGGVGSSLKLYFKTFEFNASIYFLVREIGYLNTGYNQIHQIGPIMALVTFIGIIALAFISKAKKWRLSSTWLFTLTFYLSMATTVHPWYIIPLIPLGLISGFYFPLVWSFCIFVTYAGYTPDGYYLEMFWVILEYLIVYGYMIYEIYQRNTKIKNLV